MHVGMPRSVQVGMILARRRAPRPINYAPTKHWWDSAEPIGHSRVEFLIFQETPGSQPPLKVKITVSPAELLVRCRCRAAHAIREGLAVIGLGDDDHW